MLWNKKAWQISTETLHWRAAAATASGGYRISTPLFSNLSSNKKCIKSTISMKFNSTEVPKSKTKPYEYWSADWRSSMPVCQWIMQWISMFSRALQIIIQ